MNPLDYAIVAFVLVLAFLGLRAGLISTAFSLAGLFAGLYLGARVAPALVSAWPRLGAYELPILAGAALFCGAIGRSVVGAVGRRLGSSLGRMPVVGKAFGTLNGLGGAVLGAAAGLALVWTAGVVAVQAPLPAARQAAEGSGVIQALNERVPPGIVGETLFGTASLAGLENSWPSADDPVSPSAVARRGVREAAPGVVRVSASGGPDFGSAGSGWTAAPGLVVTNAHVVEGARSVGVRGSRGQLPAEILVYDERNDVAVLGVEDLGAPVLPTGRASRGRPVAILGYPGAGPFDASPGRVGRTGPLLAADASGGLPVRRTVTSVSGEARPGNSGGPVVNGRGEVVATVFGAGIGPGQTTYAVPSSIVEERVRLAERRAGGP